MVTSITEVYILSLNFLAQDLKMQERLLSPRDLREVKERLDWPMRAGFLV
jgi:hypothetical protein